MEQMRLTIDLEALKVAYGEYIKGLEMSKAELMNLEGPFKYFDEPIFPLEKDRRFCRQGWSIWISDYRVFTGTVLYRPGRGR